MGKLSDIYQSVPDRDQPLLPGEYAPWFKAATLEGNPQFVFDTLGGRAIVMLVAGTLAHPGTAAAMAVVQRHRALFDDTRACFFGVSCDPADVGERRIAKQLPGIRWFLDHDVAVSRRLGAAANGQYRAHWLLLDPTLRVVMSAPLAEGEAVMARLQALLEEPEPAAAPVLVVPRVFDPALCRRLIDRYETMGGAPTGFMRDVGGKTVGIIDHGHKRRSDHMIEDTQLQAELRTRIGRFLVPAIKRALQFDVTRIERWLIGCYDDQEGGGHFRAHRDNTTLGTAHRRFACTINLNAEEYEGGDLSFPEFGRRRYRAPTGGAVVFSCSLLHEVDRVTRGRRYAFLPFLYDEAAAAVRERNSGFLPGETIDRRVGAA